MALLTRVVTVLCITAQIAGLSMICEQSPAAERTNFILLMGDDHGWDETGYNGHPYLKTPVLDQMASQGLRLDHFYSHGSSCSPTRASVMTGRHPNRCGTFTPGCSIRPKEITIAHLLSQSGYACGHFGKWHLGPVKESSPTNPGRMGFKQWLSHDNFFELNPVFSRNGGPPTQFTGESSEILVDEAMKFIREANRSQQPFLVVIWFGSPHEPYQGLPEDLALYQSLPLSFGSKTVSLTSNETGSQIKRPQRDVLIERFAEITAMDRAIGKLRNGLGESGCRDQTLIWYCGDNGTPNEAVATVPFRAQKGSIYEGGIRVPGIIEWPSQTKQPKTLKARAVTSDILPTLCEIARIPLPDRPLDGMNLLSLEDTRSKPIGFWNFVADSRDRRPYIAPELQEGTTPLAKKQNGKATRNFRNDRFESIDEVHYQGARAIISNHWKLVVDGTRQSGQELFDLDKDPKESVDLSSQFPAVASRLAAELRDWQSSVLNSLIEKDYR